MKKVFLFMALASAVFAACNKQEEEQVIPTKSPTTNLEGSNLKPDYICYKLFINFPNMGDIWCGAQPMNCMCAVSIIGTPAGTDAGNDYLTFSQYYDQGETADFFALNEWGKIFPSLDQKTVDKIISGQYLIKKEFDSYTANRELYVVIDASSADSENYSENDVIQVMPIELED